MGTSMVERDRDDTADAFATSSDARPQPWPAHEVQRRLSATCEGCGERNWDYRYGWIRDSSLTLNALWIAACPDEAAHLVSWIVGAAGTSMQRDTRLQIMYGIGGEHDLSERELPHLRGWRDSRPVRRQRRLKAAARHLRRAARRGVPHPRAARRARRHHPHIPRRRRSCTVDRARPGHLGIPRCWVALDRAILLAEQLGATDRIDGWSRVREEIHDLERCFPTADRLTSQEVLERVAQGMAACSSSTSTS